MERLIDLVVNLDDHLGTLAVQLGPLFPLLLAAYGFWQTGLVVGPLIPGNAVVFAVGVVTAATGSVDPVGAFLALSAGASLGNGANYLQGQSVGRRLFERERAFLTARNLERTEGFFDVHGSRAMLVAPFLPFVRSFAPFVAGVARMPLGRFLLAGTVGAFAWMGSLTAAGYFFGNLPGVRENLGLALVGFTALVMAKIAWDAGRRRAWRRKAPADGGV